MDVGKRIKDARLAKGLTQEELGAMVGLQKSAIAKYENGRVVNIKRSTLHKLAKALDLRGSDLIEDEVDNSPDELQLTEGERTLLNLFRQVPEDRQQMVLQMIQAALSSPK